MQVAAGHELGHGKDLLIVFKVFEHFDDVAESLFHARNKNIALESPGRNRRIGLSQSRSLRVPFLLDFDYHWLLSVLVVGQEHRALFAVLDDPVEHESLEAVVLVKALVGLNREEPILGCSSLLEVDGPLVFWTLLDLHHLRGCIFLRSVCQLRNVTI